MVNLNKVALYVLCGASIGALIGGIGARLAMRFVALMISGQGSFTASGTIMILFLFGMVGVPFALIFGAVRRWLPGSGWLQGAMYGLPWAALFAAFFFVNREGELALLPGWQGALIFAPIFLVQGSALGSVSDRLLARFSSGVPRMVSRPWFLLFLSSLLLAFLGMTSLMGNSIRLPRAVSEWSGLSSSDFAAVYEMHRMFGFLFLLSYVGLTTAAFVFGADRRLGRLGAVAAALFAAGWFNVEGMAAALFGHAHWVGLLSWLLRIIGAGALLYFMVEVLRSDWHAIGAAMRPALFGLVIAIGWFVALWIATFFAPSLTFRNSGLFAPLSVTVYLVPWLTLPLGILWSAWRYKDAEETSLPRLHQAQADPA